MCRGKRRLSFLKVHLASPPYLQGGRLHTLSQLASKEGSHGSRGGAGVQSWSAEMTMLSLSSLRLSFHVKTWLSPALRVGVAGHGVKHGNFVLKWI